jgi:hypothetical protein
MTSRPFDSFARCGAGSLSAGWRAVFRQLAAIHGRRSGGVRLHRLDREHEHAIGHPAPAGGEHFGRCGIRHPVEARLVEIRRAAEHLALGEDIGLAAKAIDAFDAARESCVVSRADAIELFAGRTLGEIVREFLVQHLFDLGGILAGLHGHENLQL